MKPLKQENDLGCAVACVAFILGQTYQKTLLLFKNGLIRVKEKANFYCPEIAKILNDKGKHYKWKKLRKDRLDEINKDFSIVFVKKSKIYPWGHFLVRYKNKWMDPWINLPDKNIRAGYRDELPSTPTFIIYPD